MKNLKKLLFLGTMVLALVSCGKENESGGGGGNTPSTTSNIDNNFGNQAVNFSNYNQFKSAFTSKALNSGVTDGMIVYHIGPAFGGENFGNSNWDFNVDVGFCIDFFGRTHGDCDNYNNVPGDNLQGIIDNGSYKKVISSSGTEVVYDKAVSSNASNSGFSYERKQFNRSDEFYIDMLNIDKKSIAKIVFKKATVLTESGSIQADYVEYFLNDADRTVLGFVVSNQLPLIANPIAVTKNQNFTGVLSYAGSVSVKSISVEMHDIIFDPRTGKYEAQTLGNANFSF